MIALMLGFHPHKGEYMTNGEWAIAFATFVGPIFAVQAQKWVERSKDRDGRKNALFQGLMATRMARLSPEHVRALNMIDLTFYGRQFFGVSVRSRDEKLVLATWKEYLDHLCTRVPEGEAATAAFLSSREELFINMMAAMAKERRYSVDRVQLKKGAYSPIAHNEIEQKQAAVLDGVVRVFSGERPLKIAAWPPGDAAEDQPRRA
jgi:hypothetical protein